MPSYYRDPDAPTPNRPRKVGVCFIVEIDGRVLLDRRRDDDAWAFTGGTLDDGEDVLHGLARELDEETGLAGVPRFLGLFSDPTRILEYPSGDIVSVLSLVFVVTVEPGSTPRPSEETRELRLASRAELEEVDLWPVHRPIRDAYLAWDGHPVIS